MATLSRGVTDVHKLLLTAHTLRRAFALHAYPGVHLSGTVVPVIYPR